MTPLNAAGSEATTPTRALGHGSASTRGLEATASSSLSQGRFGRMFRNLPVFAPPRDSVALAELRRLATRIVRPREDDKPLDAVDEDQNPDIPAGYTYLGQFIDHDITFDPVSTLQRQNDPDGLVDYRTPRFDLDNVYGRGPADQPYLYDPADPAKLALGRPVAQGNDAHDLPRLGNRALIGDPRNDENLIVSQLQQVFLRFHNAVVDAVRRQGFRGDDAFKEAQRVVRWHYQWIVVNDFLRAHVVGPEIVDDILRPDPYAVSQLRGRGFARQSVSILRAHLRFYAWKDEPYLPVEFSVAAYRFGHSMVRPSYFINDFLRQATGGRRFPIFSGNTRSDNLENLNGFRPLPDDWGFQWKYFYDGLTREANLPQPSYRIDDELGFPLGRLNDPPPLPGLVSLAQRNLLRGLRLGLPSGQTVSRAMGIEPLSARELDLGTDAPSFADHAPLWYYVLRESKLRCDARRLGPVGGRIVAEVLIGLLAGDPLSYLSVAPGWTPELRGARRGAFTMSDLIRFAGAA
jgi:hypothetical protein